MVAVVVDGRATAPQFPAQPPRVGDHAGRPRRDRGDRRSRRILPRGSVAVFARGRPHDPDLL